MGLHQLVRHCAESGIRVGVVWKAEDDISAELQDSDVRHFVVPDLELTPRTANVFRQARHLLRARRAMSDVLAVIEDFGASRLCINSENILLTPLAGKKAGIPTTAIMRGLRLVGLGLLGKTFFSLQQRWVSRYIVLNSLGAKLLNQNGVDYDKIHVIPNGVDTELYKPRPKDYGILEDMGIQERGPIVGCIAHMTPRKGVHHFIEVAGHINRVCPDAQFIHAGGQPSEKDNAYVKGLYGRIREIGLEKKFKLLGSREDIAELLTLFDVLVHPSETENCPRTVLEAQASAVPVVGFAVGGMPEVVEDGRSGHLIEPFDVEAMASEAETYLQNADLRQRAGNAGRQWVLEKFCLENNLSKTVDLILEPQYP